MVAEQKILRVKSNSQEGVLTTAWAELVKWLRACITRKMMLEVGSQQRNTA
jgi:hypothetical protein